MLTAYRAHTPPKAQPCVAQNKTRIAKQFAEQSLFPKDIPEDSQSQLHSKAKAKAKEERQSHNKIDVTKSEPPLFSIENAETL